MNTDFNKTFKNIIAEEMKRQSDSAKKLKEYKELHKEQGLLTEQIITEGFWKGVGNFFRHPTKKGKRKEMVNTFNNFTSSNGFSNRRDKIANPHGNHNIFWKKYNDEDNSIVQIFRSPKFMKNPEAQEMNVQVSLFQDGAKSDSGTFKIKPSTSQQEVGKMIQDVLNDIGGEALRISEAGYTTTHTEEGSSAKSEARKMRYKSSGNEHRSEAEQARQETDAARNSQQSQLEKAEVPLRGRLWKINDKGNLLKSEDDKWVEYDEDKLEVSSKMQNWFESGDKNAVAAEKAFYSDEAKKRRENAASETPKPAEAPKPPKPAEASKPVETPKPTEQRTETPKPIEKPEERKVETPKPAEAPKPAEKKGDAAPAGERE